MCQVDLFIDMTKLVVCLFVCFGDMLKPANINGLGFSGSVGLQNSKHFNDLI